MDEIIQLQKSTNLVESVVKFCENVHKSIVFCNRMAYWLRKNNIYVVIFYLNIYACSDPCEIMG